MISRKKDMNLFINQARDAIGDSLRSVILHGPEARGEHDASTDPMFLLFVLTDLELATLAKLRGPLRRWIRRGHPMPRFFTDKTIAQSADVFPMELSDISDSHVIVYGSEPFGDMHIDSEHLRLQLEREIREKLMRLQEAYMECEGRGPNLRRLIAQSYLSFISIFRGYLRQNGEVVPPEAAEVVSSFCRLLDLQSAPFIAAGSVGNADSVSLEAVLSNYYQQLVGAVTAIDSQRVSQ